MVWKLSALAFCIENQNLVPVDQQLIYACDSRSKGSETLYGLSGHAHMRMHKQK